MDQPITPPTVVPTTNANPEAKLPERICPYCRGFIPSVSNFCLHCGKQLTPKELSTTLLRRLIIYTVSFLAPPFGLIWAIKYYRTGTDVGRQIALISTVVTVISILINAWFFISIIGSLNQTLNSLPSSSLGF